MKRKADIYRRRSSSGHGRLWLLADIMVFFFTVLSGAALLAAYLSPFISPNVMWPFAFAGLVTPLLYIANLAILLYWVIRWRLMAILPLVILLAGIGNIDLFFRPAISKYVHDPEPGYFRVVSYNVEGFLAGGPEGDYVSTLDSISSLLRNLKPDVICFQEFQATSALHKKIVDSLIGLPHNRTKYKLTNSSGGGWGLAIYSRHPILGEGSVDFPDSNNSMLWVDIGVRGDTLRIFNNHLQTTSVDHSDREYINNQEFIRNDPQREERVRSILSKLGRNYRIRASQADTIAPIIRETPYKVFVCGDFNDTPMSYVYRKIRGNLSDSFAEKGRGMSNTNTYKGLFNLFRIDYVLHSREIKTVRYETPFFDYSDHKPVVADFTIPPLQGD